MCGGGGSKDIMYPFILFGTEGVIEYKSHPRISKTTAHPFVLFDVFRKL